MKLPSLIAIAGFKNAGKDTAASMLQYLLNTPKVLHTYKLYRILHRFCKHRKYKITSFAYPLKKTLAALLDIDINKFEDRSFKENYYIYFPTRQLLQVFGTECMRSTFGDKIWILTTLKNPTNKIISDLRFKTEWQAIQVLNGASIYIYRSIARPGNHASEKELEELFCNRQFDYCIDNNGSLEDLFYSLKELV